MKKQYTYIWIVVILFSSCKERNELIPRFRDEEKVTATMNGQQWPLNDSKPGWRMSGSSHIGPYILGLSTICTDKTIQMGIATFNQWGFLRETLGFERIPVRVGTYKVVRSFTTTCQDTVAESSFGLSGDDGDVGIGDFNVVETEKNYIEITSIDTVSRRLKGNFQTTYLSKYPGKHPSEYTDTLRFKGSFEIAIMPEVK